MGLVRGGRAKSVGRAGSDRSSIAFLVLERSDVTGVRHDTCERFRYLDKYLQSIDILLFRSDRVLRVSNKDHGSRNSATVS